jgi:hypothetical protein
MQRKHIFQSQFNSNQAREASRVACGSERAIMQLQLTPTVVSKFSDKGLSKLSKSHVIEHCWKRRSLYQLDHQERKSLDTRKHLKGSNKNAMSITSTMRISLPEKFNRESRVPRSLWLSPPDYSNNPFTSSLASHVSRVSNPPHRTSCHFPNSKYYEKPLAV